MIDLHIHSTASDGQYCPSEVVRLAAQTGVEVMALTDHDTIAGLEEAASEAARVGIDFIPGIEISVRCTGVTKEMHILGYGIVSESSSLKALCAQMLRQRSQRKARIFEFLSGKGIDLAPDEVEKYASNGLVARPHFARAMVTAGYVSCIREAFDLYLATPEFDRLERPKPAPKDAIKTILDSGGVPVLAHPIQLNLGGTQLEALLQELICYGIRGIEVYYSTHTPEQTAFFLSLAKKYNLIITGGSDFHGEKVKPDIALGTGVCGSLDFHDREAVRLLRAACGKTVRRGIKNKGINQL